MFIWNFSTILRRIFGTTRWCPLCSIFSHNNIENTDNAHKIVHAHVTQKLCACIDEKSHHMCATCICWTDARSCRFYTVGTQTQLLYRGRSVKFRKRNICARNVKWSMTVPIKKRIYSAGSDADQQRIDWRLAPTKCIQIIVQQRDVTSVNS